MAKVKRPLELEPLCSRPGKRRRCDPIAQPSTPTKEEDSSPFAEITAKRCPLNLDKISVSIQEEMKRLHRRKQLLVGTETEGSSCPFGTSTIPLTPSDVATNPPESSQSSQNQNKNGNENDKVLFNFQQVGTICERLIKEREDNLKEIYDEVLNTKMAEQYEKFVKFTHDRIQKRFAQTSTAPSYMS